MGDYRHKRNGVVIEEPRNWQDLEITKDFISKKDDAEINIADLVFAGEEAINIRQRVKNGLTGGVGIFEGDNYEIEVGEEGNPTFTFEGYLDYADDFQVLGCNEVKCSLKKLEGNEWLEDKADGFSFRYLQDIGLITSADFVKVPYIINYIPDNMQLIMLGISLFMMTKELVETIKSLAEAIADTTDAAIPVVGVGVGAGAVAVTAWDIGNIILTVLKVIAYIAYTVVIIIAIKNLIEELIEQLCPKKRYHLGMTLQKLFQKGCQHLGLTLSSTLLAERKDWVLIPSKDHKGGEKPDSWEGAWVETGVPSANDPWDIFGDLIRQWSENLNADFKIINGVFYFERVDFWDSIGTFQIPDYFADQEWMRDQYKPNTNDMISNYNIYWAYDVQDQNTLDNQQGRVFQAITEPIIQTNAKLRNIKNLKQVGIEASLGVRKEELTKIEKILKDLAEVVDGLTGVLGNGTSYAALIEARKGSLLLSSHFLTIPKMVVMSGSQLKANQRDILAARKLWDSLHYVNSLAEVNGHHNQWLRFENVKVPFCMEDFVVLTQNNAGKDQGGNDALIESFKWKVWEDTAVINFRIKEKYTNNLKLKYVE